MSASAEFAAFARDLFAGLVPIAPGRLFGCLDLRYEGAMFAVIFGEAIYMKAGGALAECLTPGQGRSRLPPRRKPVSG